MTTRFDKADLVANPPLQSERSTTRALLRLSSCTHLCGAFWALWVTFWYRRSLRHYFWNLRTASHRIVIAYFALRTGAVYLRFQGSLRLWLGRLISRMGPDLLRGRGMVWESCEWEMTQDMAEMMDMKYCTYHGTYSIRRRFPNTPHILYGTVWCKIVSSISVDETGRAILD